MAIDKSSEGAFPERPTGQDEPGTTTGTTTGTTPGTTIGTTEESTTGDGHAPRVRQ